jgi:hypothetical protein
MPLTPYLNEAVFSPNDIEALNAAFAAVCEALSLPERDDTRAEIVARKVIDVAGTGERDPQKIRDLVLLALATRESRSA